MLNMLREFSDTAEGEAVVKMLFEKGIGGMVSTYYPFAHSQGFRCGRRHDIRGAGIHKDPAPNRELVCSMADASLVLCRHFGLSACCIDVKTRCVSFICADRVLGQLGRAHCFCL